MVTETMGLGLAASSTLRVCVHRGVEYDPASLPAATGSAGESPHHRRLESQGARTGRNGMALGTAVPKAHAASITGG